ncbi:polysaccharide pyruvyl transferase family protein [Vibrio sp. 1CM2L]|uniref:polysaccharide pyruvyl transferase family protein n=1 Tax=Vibrio sp. 1CM2L TaxID=2929166 RepID=UPI0020C01937|nr:polysaccharide pyruvyl transferase family protein [Vibrio sp. 1CM2L]MCK8077189.1 polysaccharide pyruvyl transferase family protein [Vibrio sp. 1CM2L]
MTNEIFYISLRTQYENLGDLLITRSIVDMLAKQKRNIILNIRGVPDCYIDSFCYKPLPDNVSFTGEFIPDFKGIKFKNLLVNPGGYSGIKTKRLAFKRLLQTIYFAFFKLKGARVIREPYSISNSGTSLYNRIDRFRDVICSVNLVRDNSSLIISAGNSVYCPDLCFYFFDERDMIFSQLSEGGNRDKITISLRYDRFFGSDFNMDKYSNDGFEISYVSQVNFDDELNNRLAIQSNTTCLLYDTSCPNTISQITDLYSRSKYIISNRLHVLLLGMINGAIPLAIVDYEKDRKIIDLFETIGLSGNVFSLDSIGNLDLNSMSNIDVKSICLEQKKLLISIFKNIH